MKKNKEPKVHTKIQKMQKKVKKNYKYIKYKIKSFALFLTIVTLISVIGRFIPFQSKKDNHSKAAFPAFNISDFVNGDYFRSINDWFSATFPWNNHERELNETVEVISEIQNKVLFGRNTFYHHEFGMIIMPSMKDQMNALIASVEQEKELKAQTPMVALTFDDGPSKYTDAILDLLVQYDGKATFYIVGSRIESYPEILQRMADLGMEFGNHTFDHKVLTTMDDEEERAQLESVDDALFNVIGQKTSSIRPPTGRLDEVPSSAIDKPFVKWSIDTLDWSSRNPSSVTNIILDNVSDGDIILLHDLYETALESMEVVIPRLKEMGYELVTVSELAKAKGYTLESGKAYFRFPLVENED